ncbi:hypothetical protein J6J08_05910 [Pseudidiomarina sp. 1APR75-33.1]|uniref:competence protein CoiA family protein n=1 Tax=Pseudidiomarina terrestris TaxID=2820060 RepID=UPI00264BAEF2|nr:competence protein CoiA family protein [Pseudidiomarina sp. 1APR75-33.1]MDN7126909.1 hypothetical protein [Pseudidiomarina sp. 1APR75-33.1]
MTQSFIPFAIEKESGKFVEVSEVHSGLKCDCICPCCYGDLVARKGDVKQWHFAHHQTEVDDCCHFSFQASIRGMILQQLNKLTSIFVPCTALFKNRQLTVDALEEEDHNEHAVDFFIYSQDACIAVCLTHTQHPFDSDVLAQLPNTVSVLEIRVGEYYSELSCSAPNELAAILLKLLSNCMTSKYWRRAPDKCEFPFRPQYDFHCITCAHHWHGHEYNNLCHSCNSPLLVLREPRS